MGGRTGVLLYSWNARDKSFLLILPKNQDVSWRIVSDTIEHVRETERISVVIPDSSYRGSI